MWLLLHMHVHVHVHMHMHMHMHVHMHITCTCTSTSALFVALAAYMLSSCPPRNELQTRAARTHRLTPHKPPP